MYYYEVLVSSQKYHGTTSLTYQSDISLNPGTVVTVFLQNQPVLGFIDKLVNKPGFRTKSIESVISYKGLSPESIKLLDWLRIYYPAPLGQLTGLLLPSSLRTVKNTDQLLTTTDKKINAVVLPPLTKEQELAVRTFLEPNFSIGLLHGDTATGKTRVYIELAKKAFANKKSAIVLTPEIGLTSQLVKSFNEQFPSRVYLLHSNLTPLQRSKTWLTIANSAQPLIVIGPRSAIFSPINNLGLVVVDEAHDNAYKQEQSPYYQTTRVAAKLGELTKSRVILGSATPLIGDYYTFKSKNLPIVRMQQPATQVVSTDLDVTVVDLKDRDQFKRSGWLSEKLIDALEENLKQDQQALLFLNRRGTARLILCQVCGWQSLCPNCNVPLTYHDDTHKMQCHTCGFQQAAPTSCLICGSSEIVFRGVGTKSLVSEVKRLIPEARLIRIDSDSKKSEKLEAQYEDIHQGKVDILIGTQMLGKGLDLPRLGVVGVVLADTNLYFPDFTAEEQTFQMVNQVLGRINRGHISGKAIIQTYHADSKILSAAINKDYQTFYESQLAQRKEFNFPPFIYTLKIHGSKKTQDSAKRATEKLAQDLKAYGYNIKIIGPAPAFIEKKAGRFHWQLIVTSKQRRYLTEIISKLPGGWHYDIDPSHLL